MNKCFNAETFQIRKGVYLHKQANEWEDWGKEGGN